MKLLKSEGLSGDLPARIGPEKRKGKPAGAFAAVCTALLLLPTGAAYADAEGDYRAGVAAHTRGDVIAALELLQSAADQGHVPAMVRLGYLLDQAEENERAFRLYSRAAAQGNAEAMLAVGLMYAHGEGVGKIPRLAVEWITRAADAGHGPALVTLARLHLRGDLDLPVSRQNARRWLERGVAAGYEPARRELALMDDPPQGRTGR